METINCSKCGKQIFNTINACPYCGALTPLGLQKSKKRKTRNLIFLSIFLLFWIFVIIFIFKFCHDVSAALTPNDNMSGSPSVTAAITPVNSEATQSPKSNLKSIKVDFKGNIDPTLLREGSKLTLTLTIKNLTDNDIDDFYVYGDGDWDKFTIANVTPSGSYDNQLGSMYFYLSSVIPAQQQRAINIVLYTKEAGNFDFNFIPHVKDEYSEIVDSNGDPIVISGTVAVTK